jgi:hypothetical protein
VGRLGGGACPADDVARLVDAVGIAAAAAQRAEIEELAARQQPAAPAVRPVADADDIGSQMRLQLSRTINI